MSILVPTSDDATARLAARRRRYHPRSPPELPEGLDGDGAVVERHAGGPRRSATVSWPLPAITTTSPGSASAMAVRMAAPRSGSTVSPVVSGMPRSDGVDDGQGVLSSRVVGGQEYPIGEAGRHLAHRGRLEASRSPPAAEHQEQAAAVAGLAGRLERAGQRRRACARSRRARRRAGPRRSASKRPGTRGGRGEPGGDAVRRRCPRRAAAVAAARALLTLNRPAERELDGLAPPPEAGARHARPRGRRRRPSA